MAVSNIETKQILDLIVKMQMAPKSLTDAEQKELTDFLAMHHDLYLELYTKACRIAGESLMEKSQEYWAEQMGLKRK